MKYVGAIILMLLISMIAAAQGHEHGSMPSGDGDFNPFVTSDGRGGFYLAYIRKSGGASDVMIRHSLNGKEFSVPVRVNDRAGDATVRNENPPKIAVSDRGDVYVCWANQRGQWKGNVRFARSIDRGKTFLPAVTLNSDGEGIPAGHAFQSIAVDRTGRIYVAWIDERNKKADDRGAELWMSTSDDGGETFSQDRKVLSDVCECCRSSIQLDSTGRLFISWRTVPRQGPMMRDIMLSSSTDRGRTFVTTAVSHDSWAVNGCPVAGPALCVDAKDRVTVVWFAGGDQPGIYYAESDNHGASFSPRRLLDSRARAGKHAQATVWRDGILFVAWETQEQGEHPIVRTGLLDVGSCSLKEIGKYEDGLYPVVVIAGNFGVIAGLSAAKPNVFTRLTELKR